MKEFKINRRLDTFKSRTRNLTYITLAFFLIAIILLPQLNLLAWFYLILLYCAIALFVFNFYIISLIENNSNFIGIDDEKIIEYDKDFINSIKSQLIDIASYFESSNYFSQASNNPKLESESILNKVKVNKIAERPVLFENSKLIAKTSSGEESKTPRKIKPKKSIEIIPEIKLLFYKSEQKCDEDHSIFDVNEHFNYNLNETNESTGILLSENLIELTSSTTERKISYNSFTNISTNDSSQSLIGSTLAISECESELC